MRPQNRSYRPDIDGIRALAVLAVMLFHAFPKIVTGGYTGVDVFFVISGYLITSIILKGISSQRFSFYHFYAKRLRRIFPTLAVVLTFTICVGWMILLPAEFKQLSKHVLAGSFFSSNFLLWSEVGYFDTASELKPLLHLWSLSIEEQFYLFWPLLLALFARTKINNVYFISFVTLLSFELNVFLLPKDQTAAFYLPLARFWEILIGGVLASLELDQELVKNVNELFNSPKRKTLKKLILNLSAIAGVCLILYPMVKYSGATPFPGRRALFPTIGTLLLILAGQQSLINKYIFSNRFVVYVGLISYPLYLWHWPLLAFFKYTSIELVYDSSFPKFLILIISVVLSVLTYELIEKRLSKLKADWKLSKSILQFSFSIVLIALLFSLWPKPRLSSNNLVSKISEAKADYVFPEDQSKIHFVGKSTEGSSVLFIGDSHTQQFYHAIEILKDHNLKNPVAFSTRTGCPFLPGVNRMISGYSCAEDYERNLKNAMNPKFKRVIISGYWHGYAEGAYGLKTDPVDGLSTDGLTLDGENKVTLDQLEKVYLNLADDLIDLRKTGKEVILIGPNPDYKFADPNYLMVSARVPFWGHNAFSVHFSLEKFKKHIAWTNAQLQKVSKKSGIQLIDPSINLCPNGNCRTLDDEKTPIYMDAHHLRGFAIAKYLPFLGKIIEL